MENENNDILMSKIMADSRLNLSDAGFDNRVLCRIMREYEQKKNRRMILKSILIFTGIELVLFSVSLLIMIYFPGNSFITDLAGSVLPFFTRLGEFFLKYDYLLISFLFVGFLEIIVNVRRKILVNSR